MANKTLCPVCRQPATERFGLKLFCGFEHAAEWAKTQQDKRKAKEKTEARRKDREKLKSLKTRSEWLKEAQAVFNKYIRIRDAQKNCVSCGGKLGDKYDAGHYRSVGGHPEMRFVEINVHAQCVRCNQHLSGNLINYRKGLLIRIGQGKLDWLEGPQEPLKLTIAEIHELISKYKAKVKELSGHTT